MKKTALALALFGSVLVLNFAHAEESHPCKEIKAACEAAGFTKGGHDPKTNSLKGLYKDCIQKIVKEGQSVPGVTVSAETVAACKAKKEKRGERKGGMGKPPAATPAK